jgi:PAS domain S-box-containing protein
MAQIFPQPAPTVEAARALKRLEFLSSAAQVLSASLDYDATLRSLAQLAIPELGDLCVVDIVEDGVPRRVAAVHRLAEKMQVLQVIAERYPTTAASPTPAGRVLATGRVELLREICEPVVDLYTVDDAHADLIRSLGLRSHAAVPLVARGAVIGVLGVGRTESGEPYDGEDVLLATQLAAHAALAVENAMHFRKAQAELERRRAMEEQLARSERRLRAVIDQFPLATQLVSTDGRVSERNRACDALFATVLPAPDAPHAQPPFWTDPDAVAMALLGAPQTQPARPYPARAPGAAPRWLSTYAYPVVDEAGHVQDVVLVHQDDTAMCVATARLRDSEARLRDALVAAQMTQWHWDFATDRIECSDAAVEFWGQREAGAATFVERIEPADLATVVDAARAARETGAPYLSEYRVRRPDGTVRWLRSRGRVERDADGRAVHMIGVTVDITDRKVAEEHSRLLAEAGRCLAQSLDYEATLANVAALVVPSMADWYAVDLVSPQDTLERVSIAHPDPAKVELARELFDRYPPRRDSNYGAWNVIRTGEPEWSDAIDQAWLHGTVHDARHRVIVEGLGLNSYVRVPLQARGRTIGVMTTVFAESGRRYTRADVELMRELAGRIALAVDNAQLYTRLQLQDRRKDAFLATLAHELRNPLAPITTSARLLGMAADDPTRVRYVGTVITRQAAHMTAMVDDLLDLSRVQRGELPLRCELVDLAAAVAEAVEQVRPQLELRNHRLEVRGLGHATCVEGDRTRLTQIVANLLGNAVRYTPHGGQVALALDAEAGEAVVRVSDSGIGIAPEFLPHVFELFSQQSVGVDREHGGLGLGLALVHRLVTLHGGRVSAASAGVGQGATFTVRLPLAGGPAAD